MYRPLFTIPLVALLASISAQAIDFSDIATDNNWRVVDTIQNGCVASDPSAKPVKRQWVGDCSGDRPHGKGYLITEGLLQSAAANQGRIYRIETSRNLPTMLPYLARAEYLSMLQQIIFTPPQMHQGPNASQLAQRAQTFLNRYADAPAEDRATVTTLWRNDEARQMRDGIARAGQTVHSIEIATFLEAWGSHLSPEVRQSLIKREATLKQQYREAAEQQQRASQAREAERDQKRKNACQDYYPGHVGRYKSSGFMALEVGYVVRYVNPGRKTVTIELTDKGLGSYGELKEIACFDLWDNAK